MAFDKVIDSVQLDNDLRGVADSIRAKAGTTEELEFPEGFKNAVDNIPTGGGDTEAIEQMIDESGVLDSTEGTVEEKVEQLIDKASVKGIFLSDFTAPYNTPKIADMRGLAGVDFSYANSFPNINLFAALFTNNNGNSNGGFYVHLQELYMLDGMAFISGGMFNCCVNLHTIHGDLTKVKTIGINAFANCYKLLNIPYMPILRQIESNAFNNCRALTEIKLPNTITTIVANAFNGCTNITDIYCGFAEGAIANAPWGATNATIHYNTQFDENGNPITE